jgi:hypothetical protein
VSETVTADPSVSAYFIQSIRLRSATIDNRLPNTETGCHCASRVAVNQTAGAFNDSLR